jgi:hypothetical protein
MSADDPIPPPADDKDWTWTLDRPCPDCGFDPSAVPGPAVAEAIRASVPTWQSVLRRADVHRRQDPEVWSPLEYAAHVRDVFVLFAERAALMLSRHDPIFDNWDQDATALAARYWEADPVTVSGQLAAAGGRLADLYAGVPEDQWERTGRRSNGSTFTVATLGTYCVHDVVHHLHDVGAGTQLP